MIGGVNEEVKLTRPQLARWMMRLTAPAQLPLLGTIFFRFLDQLLSYLLFGLAAAFMVRLAVGNNGFAKDQVLIRDIDHFKFLIGAMVTMTLAKAFFRYLEQLSGHWVAFTSLEMLREEMFAKLWPQSPAIQARSRSGDLMNRATKDIDRIEAFYYNSLAPAFSAFAVPLVVFCITTYFGFFEVALIGLVGILAVTIAIPAMGGASMQMSLRRNQAARGDLAQTLTDVLQGREAICGYGRENESLAAVDEIDRRVFYTAHSLRSWEAWRKGMFRFVWIVTALILAYYGANYYENILTGSLGPSTSPMMLVSCIVSFIRSFEVARGIEDFTIDLQAAFAAAERIYRVTHSEPMVKDEVERAPEGWQAAPASVRFEDVTFTYPGIKRPALRKVSFEAPAGGRTCLIGRSGSGKTTALSLMLRFFDPGEGRIFLGDVDVRHLPQEALRSAVAMVTQNTYLFNGTIAENLLLANPQATVEDLRQACKIAGIWDDIRQMENGLDTVINEGGGRLSGGQRQRVSLARALLTPAQIFVLDEYTSQLDPGLEAQVRQRLRAARPQATIIEITHRMGTLEGADRVLRFDAGLVADVTAEARSGKFNAEA